MAGIFHDMDLKAFWEKSDYATKEYVEPKPTAAAIKSIEDELGVKLPASYIELMHSQNGGIPRNQCFPTKTTTSWAEDHVAITGIMGIGQKKTYSLCGELGSRFMQEEWGYPDFGICICDCPSAGHDMIMLDYRHCGKTGEPKVIHVDQESDYEITPLAKDFETFVRGLVNRSVYDTSAADLVAALAKIDKGAFSKQLKRLLAAYREADLGPIIRKLCRNIAVEKGYFALRADEKSHLMYDIQFLLASNAAPIDSPKAFYDSYPFLVAMAQAEFTVGGYAPDFIKEWLEKRIADRNIIKAGPKGLVFSNGFLKKLTARLQELQ